MVWVAYVFTPHLKACDQPGAFSSFKISQGTALTISPSAVTIGHTVKWPSVVSREPTQSQFQLSRSRHPSPVARSLCFCRRMIEVVMLYCVYKEAADCCNHVAVSLLLGDRPKLVLMVFRSFVPNLQSSHVWKCTKEFKCCTQYAQKVLG